MAWLQQAIAAGLIPDLDGETTVVRTDWHFAGHEHPPFPLLAGGAA